AVTRDLALLLPERVVVAAVAAVVRETAGALLESVQVIDEYRGKGLPAGRRGVALRLVLRARERTLRDAEVDDVIKRVLATLDKSLDVTVRSA
ncbi:MAG TPA: hypothetical protein VIP80_05075, partial [Gemmatimonadales bacterium]